MRITGPDSSAAATPEAKHSPWRGYTRFWPKLKAPDPLLIGSGDRCARVRGSCYKAEDPAVSSWLASHHKIIVGLDSPLRSPGVVILTTLGLACFFWFGMAPLRRQWHRRRSTITTPSTSVRSFVGSSVLLALFGTGVARHDQLGATIALATAAFTLW